MNRATLCAIALLVAVPVSAAEIGAKQSPNQLAAKYNMQLGIAYLKDGEVGLAREKIDKALKQNSSDPDVQTAAGLLYEALGEMDTADHHYSEALHLDSQNPDKQNNYGQFLCRRGRYDKGEKLLESAAKSPLYTTPQVAYTNAAVCARTAGKLDQSEKYLRSALNLAPNYPDALLQLADLSYMRGALPQAQELLGRYFQVSNRTPDALLLGVKIERAAGDYHAAEDYATTLRKEFPASAQARHLADGTIK
jgi:type IV pilus assembly protein PilF